MNVDIAFIGGSGFYNPDLLDDPTSVQVKTPFGHPSSEIVIGQIGGITCAFLARHGAGHRFSPSRINYRANIYALKTLGAPNIVAISAVGSLKEEITPLSTVIPDQIFDRTHLRSNTFFDEICVHVGMANPFCASLSTSLWQASKRAGSAAIRGGTYVCIEGPQFSTRAESNTYRHLGFDVIGMTAVPEAKLIREAEMCFSMLATVTDYDVWREDVLTSETVISNVQKNSAITQKIIQEIVAYLPQKDETCECKQALKEAIVTHRQVISDETLEKLRPLIGNYMG